MAKIYTRRGDDGSTGLFGGPRVRKDDLRVAAYGEADELNSALGMAREELRDERQKDLAAIVDRLQSELFTLGSELATPDAEAAPKEVPRIAAEHVSRLEGEIDRLTAELPPMRNFILPGGSRPGAALHLCRTVCRRADDGGAVAGLASVRGGARVPEPALRSALRHGARGELARRRHRDSLEAVVRRICSSSDLSGTATVRFELPERRAGLVPVEGFAYRAADGGVRAWLNVCPHRLQPIDLGDGRLFNRAGEIECAAHGARFDPASGNCIGGPCEGSSLNTIEAVEQNGGVFIEPASGILRQSS
jgi:cob(I)alamin adenosyltransferase